MSETFTYSQLITVTVFLSVLIGLMFLVRRFKGPLKAQLGGDRRIKLIEDTGIGGHERIKLVTIDGQTYLVLTTKNQAPVMMPMDSPPSAMPAAGPKRSAPKPASPAPKAAADQNSQRQASTTTPFLKAMQQARQRNPLLGLSQS
jgi:flagellar biogenesis protein FliO